MTNISKSPAHISRRRFLQIIAVAGAAGLAYKLGFSPFNGNNGYQARQSRVMMGTLINLIVYAPDEEQCHLALAETFTRMEKLESLFSRYQPESEVSRLNRDGHLPSASPDLLNLLEIADEVHLMTNGAFDISVLPLLQLYKTESLPDGSLIENTLPLIGYDKVKRHKDSIRFTESGMGITVDGIGKGYIVDQGVASLNRNGFENVYVEAGGDLMASGIKQGGQPWRIGIRNPRPETAASLMTIEASNQAVATSGDYIHAYSKDRRHHHILDPRTGVSPPELASATVLAPTVALADALATSAMVMGVKQSIELIESMDGCEGFFIDKDLSRHQTSSFRG